MRVEVSSIPKIGLTKPMFTCTLPKSMQTNWWAPRRAVGMSPTTKLLGRADVPGQNWSPSPGAHENKVFGVGILDPKAQTSMTWGGSQKNFLQEHFGLIFHCLGKKDHQSFPKGESLFTYSSSFSTYSSSFSIYSWASLLKFRCLLDAVSHCKQRSFNCKWTSSKCK